MSKRIAASTVLASACALVIIVGVVNAGREPAVQVPAQASQPTLNLDDVLNQAGRSGALVSQPLPPVSLPWPPCPGTEDIQNIHVSLSPTPDYVAEGKAQGMTEDQARAYAAKVVADQQEMLRRTLATVPPPNHETPKHDVALEGFKAPIELDRRPLPIGYSGMARGQGFEP
jgi:hypothetical protein